MGYKFVKDQVTAFADIPHGYGHRFEIIEYFPLLIIYVLITNMLLHSRYKVLKYIFVRFTMVYILNLLLKVNLLLKMNEFSNLSKNN